MKTETIIGIVLIVLGVIGSITGVTLWRNEKMSSTNFFLSIFYLLTPIAFGGYLINSSIREKMTLVGGPQPYVPAHAYVVSIYKTVNDLIAQYGTSLDRVTFGSSPEIIYRIAYPPLIMNDEVNVNYVSYTLTNGKTICLIK